MSAETITWLNRKILVGFTSKRGQAWHYRAEEQDGIGNHYEGAIPLDRATELLASPALTSATITANYITESGVQSLTPDDRQAIVRPVGAFGADDPGAVLGVFKSGFTLHEYVEWLLTNLGTLLDDDLALSSVGLLKGGAVAFAQVEMPESITTPEGVAFRPFLSAATSVDGSLASTYQTGSQVIVCDNTLAASLSEKQAARIKVKHSKKSMGRVGDVREALQIVHTVAEDFAAEVAALTAIKVDDKTWQAFLEAHVGDKDDMRLSPKSRTILDRKHRELTTLWEHDERVTPWKGTGFGVLQAVNTWGHHIATVKRTDRVERNALNAITGQTAKADHKAVDDLLLVAGLA